MDRRGMIVNPARDRLNRKLPLSRRRPCIYLNRHTPPGQSRVYRVIQLRNEGVHCRESAGTGPIFLKAVGTTGAAFSAIPIDQFLGTFVMHQKYRRLRRCSEGLDAFGFFYKTTTRAPSRSFRPQKPGAWLDDLTLAREFNFSTIKIKIKTPNGWRTIKSLAHKIRLHGRRGKGMAESFSREKLRHAPQKEGG